MIGLSLSFCIKDILSGKVNVAEVEKIITSTMAYDVIDFNRLICQYLESYWEGYSYDTVLDILSKVKIEQPRIHNKPHPRIYNGHWVMSEDDIIWSDS